MKYLRSLKEIGIVEGILLALCVAGAIAAMFLYSNYQSEIRRLENEIATKKAELGYLQSSVGIVGTSVTDNQSIIEYLAAQISLMCHGQTASGPQTTESLNRASLRSHDLNRSGGCITTAPVIAFLSKYNAALTARLGGDNKKAQLLFVEALAAGNASQFVDEQWKARAYEGTAYALMKQAKYAEAGRAVDNALKVFPGFVFAEITKLKLGCAQNRPAVDVTAALAAVRAKRDADVADAEAGVKKAKTSVMKEATLNRLRFAKLDRSYVEADGELFAMCAYAGIAAERR